MSLFTTYLHFANDPVLLPNADPNTGNAEAIRLQAFIAQYEPQYLEYMLGYELSQLLINGVGDGSIYDLLANGDTFTDTLNLTQKWEGFTTVGKNPIANYIYWVYQNSNASITFGIGEANASVENGTRISPAPKCRRAWNEMVKFNNKLHGYLYAKRTLYPTYIGLKYPPGFGVSLPVGAYADEVDQFQNLFIKQTWI